jgi:hypothetical protein
MDKNVKIWRYMDIAKYISLLEFNSLFFPRSDLFEDSYEGATSHANKLLRHFYYKDNSIPSQAFTYISKHNEWSRQWTYISCWHMNEDESEAMWKLYTKGSDSIAVQSRFNLLSENLPDSVFLGVVNYINYETDWLPEGNAFWPFVHKRKAFEHERELRGVIQKYPFLDNQIERWKINDEYGVLIPVDLHKLIESVYVAPTATKWFESIVTSITTKYGYTFKINQSELAIKPEF